MMSIMSNQPIRSPVLIGREKEVDRLRMLIDRAAQGHGQVLLISGEAGVGKSRLLAEGTRRASEQGFLVLQGTCFPTDRTSPYAPLLDLLSYSHTRELLSLSPASSEPLARELARLFPGLLDHISEEMPLRTIEPEQDKLRFFIALSQFFTGLADTQPVLFVIEDLHWSDETSLEALHYLARSSAHHPLLLVLTYGNDEMHPGLSNWLPQLDREHLAQEFVLPLLSRNEVEMMLWAIFDQPGPMAAEILDAIYRLTEGNPFFIEEILKSLILTGAIVSCFLTRDGRPASP
jgi:predicted ATPase